MYNAPVMLAAMALLQIRYEFLFCLGCLAHKVNTLVKHLIKDNDMNDIFEIVEKISTTSTSHMLCYKVTFPSTY